MTAKELKNAILQEAVQGLLVPQIKEEGNAKELLEKIKNCHSNTTNCHPELDSGSHSKQMLKRVQHDGNSHTDLQISTKSAKGKVKALPPVTDDEMPFEIPESWCWVNITDIATCELGKTKDTQKNTGTLKNYLCSINIQENGIDLSKIKQMKFEDTEFERYSVKKNDLLICEGGDAGRCAIYTNEEPIHYQNALHRIRFFNEISNTFYLYLFKVYKENKILQKLSKGVTIQHLTGTALKSLPIPLPPLAEQKRIVDAIEKLLPLVEEYGKKEELLTSLNSKIASLSKKAILQEAVQGRLVPQIKVEGNARDLLNNIKKCHTDLQISTKSATAKGKEKSKALPPVTEEEMPFEIPESWCWCYIEDITKPIGNKSNQVQTKEILREGKIPVVSQGQNLIDGYSNEIKKTIKDIPLILFGDHTRNVKYIDFPFVIGADGTKLFKPIICDEKFIYYLILYVSLQLKNRGYARHYSLLKNTPIPLPPLAEQKRIVTAIEKLLPLCEKLGK